MQNMQGDGYDTVTDTVNTDYMSTIESSLCRSEAGLLNQNNWYGFQIN